MKENGPSNIFDEASRRFSKMSQSKKKSASPKKEDISKPKKDVQQTSSAPSAPAVQDAEIEAMFTKVKLLREDVVKKLDALERGMGMSVKDVKEYLDNPRNFKKGVWEVIQRQRKMIEGRIFDLMSKDMKGKVQKQEAAKTGKERKKKSLGARKKWIQVK